MDAGVETCLQSALDDALAPANNEGTIPTGMEGLSIDVRTGIGDGSSVARGAVQLHHHGGAPASTVADDALVAMIAAVRA